MTRWPGLRPCRAALVLGALLAACPAPPAPAPCTGDRDCPADFVCAQPAGLCQRVLPASDAGRDDGPVRDRQGVDGAEPDAASPDRAVLDSAPADTARLDAAPTESGVSDARIEDGASADAAAQDAGVADLGAVDLGAVDLGPVDLGPPPPSIEQLQASPSTIGYGENLVLQWLARDATQCLLDGALVAEAPGALQQLELAPQATRSIELCCSGPGGTTCAQLEVQVLCASPVVLSGPLFVDGTDRLAELGALSDGCWKVEGDLIIGPSVGLRDLAPLLGLVEVSGTLDIIDNVDLESLHGLEALTSVGDALALGRWDSVSGHLGNPVLQGLEGLSGLRRVGGNLTVQYSLELPSLRGLDELRAVGGDLLVQYCDEVGDLRGLRRLASVGGYLALEDLPRVSTLDGLQSLRQVGTFLWLVDMAALADLTALGALDGVVTNLYVRNCPQLQDLQGLHHLRMSGGLELKYNSSLQSLAGLPAAVSGSLVHVTIVGNPALVSLQGLQGLQVVRRDPDRVCTAARLAASTCAGMLVIVDNDALTTLDGLDGVQAVEDALLIEDNAGLLNLDALGQLTGVGGLLRLRRNPGLDSVDGLGQLGRIDGGLVIESNGALLHLSGLGHLAILGGNGGLDGLPLTGLQILGNPQLTTLGVNLNCQFDGQVFQVRDNPALPAGQAHDLYAAWCAGAVSCPVAAIDGNGP